MRYDYRGNFSEQMRLYWKLRGQLKLVAMGNSHATKGISTKLFYNSENRETPFALNLAPAGANNALQCLIIRDYVMQLPQLEWVIWVASARSFNQSRKDDRKWLEFSQSSGRRYDEQHWGEIWPLAPAKTLVTTKEAWAGIANFDAWGWEGRRQTKLPTDPVELRRVIFDQMDSTRFTFSTEKFTAFSQTVRELNARGIRVMIVTTPLHPLSVETKASDPDGTTHEGFKEMVAHMEELDRELPATWFFDYHRGGHHGWPTEEFYDVDHLTRNGSYSLTRQIIKHMEQCPKP